MTARASLRDTLASRQRLSRLQARVERLRKLLQESYDHHEYCGWGDPWERECVSESGLCDRIMKELAR